MVIAEPGSSIRGCPTPLLDSRGRDAELHDAETYLKLTETLDGFRARLAANAEN